jgi:hypothetical protein
MEDLMAATSRPPHWRAPLSAPDGAGGRPEAVDHDLLRRIGQDLRSVYGDILNAPLPDGVARLLVLLDDAVARERDGVESQA